MKKSGRPFGKLDKMKPKLRADIERYMSDRSVQLGPLLQKNNICRNTFKKYMRIISEGKRQVTNQRAYNILIYNRIYIGGGKYDNS